VAGAVPGHPDLSCCPLRTPLPLNGRLHNVLKVNNTLNVKVIQHCGRVLAAGRFRWAGRREEGSCRQPAAAPIDGTQKISSNSGNNLLASWPGFGSNFEFGL